MVYADDVAIVANNMEQLQRVANRWHEEYKYFGVHLNKKNEQEGDINMRIHKYNNTMTMLYPLLKQRVPKAVQSYNIHHDIKTSFNIWLRNMGVDYQDGI